MLLGAALLPAAKAEAAALPDFTEICTPQGIVLRTFGHPTAAQKEEIPDPDSGSPGWESCPICSAFGQHSLGMPTDLALIGRGGGPDQPIRLPLTLARGQDIQLPQTRAPPRPH